MGSKTRPRGTLTSRFPLVSRPFTSRRQPRALPAKDGFLQARDRDLLLPDAAHRKAVFPTIGGPGVVLHEAIPVGTWRGAVKGKRFELTVAPFGTLRKAVWAEVEAERSGWPWPGAATTRS